MPYLRQLIIPGLVNTSNSKAILTRVLNSDVTVAVTVTDVYAIILSL